MEKQVVLLELTNPWKENLKNRHDFKLKKYKRQIAELREGQHNGVKWNAQLFCVEIGMRGAYHEMAWGRMCGAFGIYKEARKTLLDAMQTAAIQCSHFIFLCRFQQNWTPQALRDTWSTPPGVREKVSSAKEDSNETCLKDGAQGSFYEGNTSERPTMRQVFADISAGMLEEMLPNCLE